MAKFQPAAAAPSNYFHMQLLPLPLLWMEKGRENERGGEGREALDPQG